MKNDQQRQLGKVMYNLGYLYIGFNIEKWCTILDNHVQFREIMFNLGKLCTILDNDIQFREIQHNFKYQGNQVQLCTSMYNLG